MQDIPHSRKPAILFFQSYIEQNRAWIKDASVFDVSSGSGYIAQLFVEAGARVKTFDLFPEQNKFCSVPPLPIDLQKTFPIEAEQADMVICSETIEHLPNPFFFFEEVSRILKKGGHLYITTPNSSSLRARFSYFISESESYKQPFIQEKNSMAVWDEEKGARYFSRIFLLGINKCRILASLNGLKIVTTHKSAYSTMSVLLLWTYPVLYFLSWLQFRKTKKLYPNEADTAKEIFKRNTSLSVLLSKHLIVIFQKK